MKEVNIYTCTGLKNPKTHCGKAGYVLEYTPEGSKPVTLTKIMEIEDMTPQQSELHAINGALSRLTEKGLLLNLHTENRMAATALTEGWVQKWKEAGWKKPDGKPVKNCGEWEQMLGLLDGHVYTATAGQPHPYRMWLMMETERR